MSGFVCGIDGGGTSTRVALGDLDGRVLGVGRAPSGNLHDVGADGLRANLVAAWQGALEAAGLDGAPEVVLAFGGMASVGTAPERERVAQLVTEAGIAPAGTVTIDIDLVAAHAAALAGEPGVALIAGTGSSCLGRDPGGARHQAGGWGSLLDDVGGATWVGTQAMVAAVRAHDGRGPETSLTAAVMEHFGLAHLRELLVRVDANHLGRGERAALSRLVTEAADAGDEAATAVLRTGAAALAECVEAVVRTLDFPGEVLVGATGGLVDGAPRFRAFVHEAVEARVGVARCIEPRTTNVRGALLEALRLHQGGTVPAAVRDRVLAG